MAQAGPPPKPLDAAKPLLHLSIDAQSNGDSFFLTDVDTLTLRLAALLQ
jgi:hypothetical protein